MPKEKAGIHRLFLLLQLIPFNISEATLFYLLYFFTPLLLNSCFFDIIYPIIFY